MLEKTMKNPVQNSSLSAAAKKLPTRVGAWNPVIPTMSRIITMWRAPAMFLSTFRVVPGTAPIPTHTTFSTMNTRGRRAYPPTAITMKLKLLCAQPAATMASRTEVLTFIFLSSPIPNGADPCRTPLTSGWPGCTGSFPEALPACGRSGPGSWTPSGCTAPRKSPACA